MLKAMFEQITEVVKDKINKLELNKKFEKHSNYVDKAKEVWDMVNEDLGISNKVENKLAYTLEKLDKFEKILKSKFPELTKDDILEIKQNIIKELTIGKEIVLSKDVTNKLKDFNTKLQEENIKLKRKLSEFGFGDIKDSDDENK